jgi:hypothetical protein
MNLYPNPNPASVNNPDEEEEQSTLCFFDVTPKGYSCVNVLPPSLLLPLSLLPAFVPLLTFLSS